MSFKPGDSVCWLNAKRDRPEAPLSNKETFTIQKISANGRCELVDHKGAQLFNIPFEDLQLLDPTQPSKRLLYQRKGMRLKGTFVSKE